jgi:hypothetical protein
LFVDCVIARAPYWQVVFILYKVYYLSDQRNNAVLLGQKRGFFD